MPGFEKCASYEKWTGFEKWVQYEEWVRYEKWTECVIHTRCMPNRGSEASWVILTPGVSILGRGQWRLHSQILYHFSLKISPPASNWMYLSRIFASNLTTVPKEIVDVEYPRGLGLAPQGSIRCLWGVPKVLLVPNGGELEITDQGRSVATKLNILTAHMICNL